MGLCDCLRFVSDADCQIEQLPWGPHEWLCRPGITEARDLQVVRVRMPPGRCHAFHRHPEFEEVLYVLDGQVEQFVDRQKRVLRAGELAHIPKDTVHGSYNVFRTPCTFLAILSPASCKGPPLIDVAHDEPWKSLAPLPPPPPP